MFENGFIHIPKCASCPICIEVNSSYCNAGGFGYNKQISHPTPNCEELCQLYFARTIFSCVSEYVFDSNKQIVVLVGHPNYTKEWVRQNVTFKANKRLY